MVPSPRGRRLLGCALRWLRRRKSEGKATLFDPDLFKSKLFSFGIRQSVLQNIALGGLLIALPIYLQLDLGYNALEAGLSLAPLSLTMFFVAVLAGRQSREAAPEQPHPGRLRAARPGRPRHDPARPAGGHEPAIS